MGVTMDPVYPHVATVWHALPEVDGHARWSRSTILRARCESDFGTRAGSPGETATTRLTVLVPESASATAPASCGDKVALGDVGGDSPAASARRVAWVSDAPIGPSGARHWEMGT